MKYNSNERYSTNLAFLHKATNKGYSGNKPIVMGAVCIHSRHKLNCLNNIIGETGYNGKKFSGFSIQTGNTTTIKKPEIGKLDNYWFEEHYPK